jgi:hypothetical protein
LNLRISYGALQGNPEIPLHFFGEEKDRVRGYKISFIPPDTPSRTGVAGRRFID